MTRIYRQGLRLPTAVWVGLSPAEVAAPLLQVLQGYALRLGTWEPVRTVLVRTELFRVET